MSQYRELLLNLKKEEIKMKYEVNYKSGRKEVLSCSARKKKDMERDLRLMKRDGFIISYRVVQDARVPLRVMVAPDVKEGLAAKAESEKTSMSAIAASYVADGLSS